MTAAFETRRPPTGPTKFNERLHSELSDTSSTSHGEDEESLIGSEASDHSDHEEQSEYNSEDEDSESSWDEDDHLGLEEELQRFALSRASSCSKLGGGFPSLGPKRQVSAVRMPRRSSSTKCIKELLIAAGLQEDDGVITGDNEDVSEGSETDRSESQSEGVEEHLKQLKASVDSIYNREGLTRPPKAVPPKLDGELGLVEKTDKAIESFVQARASQPLTIVQTGSHQTTKTSVAKDITKPAKVLRSILGYDTRDSYPSQMWEGYFLEVQHKHIRAHTKAMEVMIRCEAYGKLRGTIRNGQTLQSCNQHGESIVHLACRRASAKLLKFLIREAQITVRVRDDCGRSPLHDTCWSYNDRFDVFKTLVEDSPELLFVEDKRGFSPFDYIPKERWHAWNKFLEANADFLRKTVNVVDLADMDAQYQRTHS